MPKFKISQSLMKAYVDYLTKKECGLFFKAKYIDKDPEAQTEASEAMKLGIYFEFLCTGALPKSGEIPEPDFAYKGTPKQKLSEPYARVVESSKLFKKIIDHYGIKILEKGLSIDAEINGIPISGVIDIYAEWDGKPVFIDTKYSGLIDDKWNEMGWDLESLHMKDSIMIQGVHYKLLADKKMGIPDIPFYYFVFSSKDPNNIKLIRQEVDEEKRQAHIVAIGNISERIEKDLKFGFSALPSLSRCSSCPIAHKCPSKVDYPLVDTIYY